MGKIHIREKRETVLRLQVLLLLSDSGASNSDSAIGLCTVHVQYVYSTCTVQSPTVVVGREDTEASTLV